MSDLSGGSRLIDVLPALRGFRVHDDLMLSPLYLLVMNRVATRMATQVSPRGNPTSHQESDLATFIVQSSSSTVSRLSLGCGADDSSSLFLVYQVDPEGEQIRRTGASSIRRSIGSSSSINAGQENQPRMSMPSVGLRIVIPNPNHPSLLRSACIEENTTWDLVKYECTHSV